MFSVRPVCRFVILVVAMVMLAAVNFFMDDTLTAVLSVFALVWLWFYLLKLKIEIRNDCLIKHSGNIFQHKTLIMLKNIFYMQILTFAPRLPAVIRIHSRGKRIFIIGLDGGQSDFLEKAVTAYKKY